jgi:plastocyanin
MIRRAALTAVILLMLSTASASAATKIVSIYSSHYTPASVTVAMGGSVQWKNTTGKKHNVTPDAFFLGTAFWPSTTVKAHTKSSPITFPEAGTFTYHDSLSGALRGTVTVPMTADMAVVSLGSSLTLTLGTVPASNLGPMWHEVQARVNGGSWTTAATTGGNTTGFHPSTAGTWELQTRLHHALSGANTGWSPILTITAI